MVRAYVDGTELIKKRKLAKSSACSNVLARIYQPKVQIYFHFTLGFGYLYTKFYPNFFVVQAGISRGNGRPKVKDQFKKGKKDMKRQSCLDAI